MRHYLVIGLTAALSLGAGQALAQNCPLKQLGSIALERGGPDDGLLIPVYFNQQPSNMILDTSMGYTTVTPQAVAALKLPAREERDSVQSTQNSSGYTSAVGSKLEAEVDELIVGLAGKFSKNSFLVENLLSGSVPQPGAGAPAGRLGLEILTHFDFDFNFATNTMNMFDTNHCSGGAVVYWKTDAATPIPFEYDGNGRIAFKVMLDGTRLTGILDTGRAADKANLDILKRDMNFDETAADLQKLPSGADGGKVYSRRFKTLEMGGITIQNPLIIVAEDKSKKRLTADNSANVGSSIHPTELNREPDLRIGLDTLSKMHVYVAVKEKKLYVSPAGQ